MQLQRRLVIVLMAACGLAGCASMDPKTEPKKPRDPVEWRENELQMRDSDNAVVPYGIDDRAKQVERNLGIR